MQQQAKHPDRTIDVHLMRFNGKRLSDARPKAGKDEQRSWRQINLVGLNRGPQGAWPAVHRGMLGAQPGTALAIMGKAATRGIRHLAHGASEHAGVAANTQAGGRTTWAA